MLAEPRKQETHYRAAIAISAVFILLLIFWYWLDRTVPVYDSANHLLKGYACRDILLSGESLPKKFLDIFNLGIIYPPLMYFIAAVFKLVFGIGVWADRMPVLSFYALMCFSTYKLALHTLGNSTSAALTVMIVCLNPMIFLVSHAPGMLEIPFLALLFTALWRMVVWQKQPNWTNTALISVAAIASVLVKQTTLFFVIFPLLALTIQFARRKSWNAAVQGLTAFAATCIALLVWLLCGFSQWIAAVSEWQAGTPKTNFLANFLNNLWQYITVLGIDLTPFWLLLLICCLINWKDAKLAAIPLISAVGGVICLCFLNWTPQSRYLIAALPFGSLIIAATLSKLWQQDKFFTRIAVILVFAITTCEFVFLNFIPYPIICDPAPLAVLFQAPYYNSKDNPYCPETSEYGLETVVNFLKKQRKTDATRPPIVCVIPYSRHFNAQSLEYAARVSNIPLLATACKAPILQGFRYDLDEQKMHWIDYFLVVSPEEKEPKEFVSQQDADQCRKLVDKLCHSKNFQLVDSLVVKDNRLISLYRKKAN